MKKEYQPGEFCKDIDCWFYEEGKVKTACEDACRAYKFHDWLIKNGYKIVREEE